MPTVPGKKVIGLTGTMGSGKSTVLKILKESIPVIDCDSINRDLLKKGAPGYNALKEAGLLKVTEDGEADKAAMSKAMFSSKNPSYKERTETILQNLILKTMDDWIESQQGLCAVEVPLLFELHLEDHFDEIWCVTASRDVALQRLEKFRKIDRDEALSRLNHQSDPESKIQNSTRVLVNDHDLAHLEADVKKALRQAAKD